MSFLGLGTNYNRPGPGIPKDVKKKKGAALFFDILGREFWSLLTVNLIYLLACLPIVTIGPATVALSRITVTMVRDVNVYPWRDFWDAFRKNWKQGLLFGIPATLFVYAAISLNLSILMEGAGLPVLVVIYLWTFLGVSLGCYLFPLVAYVELPILPCLKNALFLTILGKFRTLAAVVVSVAVVVLAICFFPLSLLPLAVLGLSLLSLFTSFMVWPVISKFVLRDSATSEEAEAPST